MANLFVRDNQILWLQIPKVGTPSVWEPGTVYRLGDVVVPTNPPLALANFMFQCVGFLGNGGSAQPTFPAVVGNTVIDNQVVWTCQDPTKSPPPLTNNEYFLIDEFVTTM